MTLPESAGGRVEIQQAGAGGTIVYREAGGEVRFTWEFASSPAIALIFGPSAGQWNALGGWAAGRRAEIFHAVAAEAVHQQAASGSFAIDLESGTIEILKRRG